MTPSHYFSSETDFLDAPSLRDAPSLPVSLSQITLHFLTGVGVFSRGALDAGTALLLENLFETLPTDYAGAIGDLGCGWGAVGAFCAQHWSASRVFSVDVNPRATQLAHQNFTRNTLDNATAWCGDGFSSARSQCFDLIAVNPPVRAGNTVIQKLFDDSQRVLRAGGDLWVVLRTAQGAKSWQKRLASQFGTCETVQIQSGYRILRCAKAD